MNSISRILEKVWLVIAIACGITAVYKAFFVRMEDAIYFLFFGVMATLWWYLRRRLRLRFEAREKAQEEES